jgi:cell division protein FtsB
MDRDSLVMEQLAAQRTAALDQLAIRTADLALAQARVKALEAEIDKLKEKGESGGVDAPA